VHPLSDAFIDSTANKSKSTWWEKWLEVSSVLAVNLITLVIFIIVHHGKFMSLPYFGIIEFSLIFIIFISTAIMLISRAFKIKHIKNVNRRHAHRCRTELSA
jgi:uncharacterized membrane protein